ncbi:restriction endonuclease subunit S [Carboxylicivirga marina]|uniref:restriction endonuclease subunit S n=1 Tax=Carboxylicivirga marina TaxID=2800988 RepID=UPI0025995131|nr:restriction endonuclease subunit S [uncultured Carboxylicivirga sp.]
MTITDINTDFKKYQTFKNSGVEWIGEIPEHWEVESFKNILTERNEKNAPIRSTERLSLSIDKGVTLYAEKTTNLDRFKDDFTQYKLAYKGDLVLNSMNMIVGAVGVTDFFGCVSPVYYTYHGGLNNSYTTKFCEYLFRCKTVQNVLYSLGRGLIAIDRGEGKYNTLRLKVARHDLRSLRLPLPNLSEQTAIVNFLDDKTAHIDKAIAQKERLIALLKERMQILIQKAITKGLDNNVEMIDSGMEWIGEIPEHWEVKKLKYVVKILKRIIGYEGPDVLSITQNGIKVKDISSGEGQLAMDYSKYQIINKGEFAMNHMDLLTGYVDISKFDGVISPDYRVFAPIYEGITDEFLLKLFQIGYKSKIFYGFGQGVSLLGRWRFPADNFNNFIIPVPPKKEQTEIISFLKNQSAKTNKAIGLQEQQIEKLKEYKSVLIDNAVKGKIKVA